MTAKNAGWKPVPKESIISSSITSNQLEGVLSIYNLMAVLLFVHLAADVYPTSSRLAIALPDELVVIKNFG